MKKKFLKNLLYRLIIYALGLLLGDVVYILTHDWTITPPQIPSFEYINEIFSDSKNNVYFLAYKNNNVYLCKYKKHKYSIIKTFHFEAKPYAHIFQLYSGEWLFWGNLKNGFSFWYLLDKHFYLRNSRFIHEHLDTIIRADNGFICYFIDYMHGYTPLNRFENRDYNGNWTWKLKFTNKKVQLFWPADAYHLIFLTISYDYSRYYLYEADVRNSTFLIKKIPYPPDDFNARYPFFLTRDSIFGIRDYHIYIFLKPDFKFLKKLNLENSIYKILCLHKNYLCWQTYLDYIVYENLKKQKERVIKLKKGTQIFTCTIVKNHIYIGGQYKHNAFIYEKRLKK